MAVESVLIINNYGKPRLATFYRSIPPTQQQRLIRTIFKLVSNRPDGDVCNFLDAPELDPLLQLDRPHDGGKGKGRAKGDRTDGTGGDGAGYTRGQERRVIYRHYATLWFVFVVDQSESELGILDLIQVFVESLDRFFPNVCELDLIFHYEEVNAILAEVIQGGLVLETNISEIVKQAQATAKARKASAAGPRPPGIGGSGPTGTGFDVGLNAASAAADTLGGWARDWLGRR